MQPQESQFPGYYHHPKHTSILVSKSGDIFNLTSGKSLKQNFSGFIKYKVVDIPKVGQKLVHRLVAETFLADQRREDQKLVNHKDGDKEHNYVDNLEWVNARENHEHAYRQGLRDDNRHVVVRNLETGEEQEFYALNECARWFDVNPERVHRWLNSSETYPFQGCWNLRYKENEWKPLSAADIGRKSAKEPSEIILYDPEALQLILFGSCKQASEYIGCAEATIASHVRKENKVFFRGYYIYFREDVDAETLGLVEDQRKPTRVIKQTPTRKPTPIRVTNLRTNEVTDWDSVESFAKAHGAKKGTVQKNVSTFEGRWRYFHIEYLDH